MNVFGVILGMMVVTYIPRALPALVMGKIQLSPRVELFLRLIPYSAMTALIIPGIFSVHEKTWVGAVGGLVAIVCAYKKMPTIVVVIVAVLVNTVLQMNI